MLTNEEALELVSQELQKMSSLEDPFIVNEARTMKRPFGWVFFYNSKRFLKTGEVRYRLAGNGPVIVNKATHEILLCGSDKPVDELIHEYENKLVK